MRAYADRGGVEGFFFIIAGGLYSVTALRKTGGEKTVHAKYQELKQASKQASWACLLGFIPITHILRDSTSLSGTPREGPGKGSAASRSSKSAETRRVGVLVMPSGTVLEGRGPPLQTKSAGLPGITRQRVGLPLKIFDETLSSSSSYCLLEFARYISYAV